ncbi:MAG: hypothetical protein O3A19_09055 [Planctomycetota bacterium]|jgi:hypothetical protein|nr:hypothetical protein [Planctomycetota bacterium]MDA1026562.1 hypothetical protein [Planctomycetota bacterium]
MSVTSARMRMQSEYKELAVAWRRVSEVWRDPVSRAFYERRIQPLERRIRSAATAMEQLEGELSQARRDCGDD